MAFHESFGEVPQTLLTTLKRCKVTPAEFYALEMQGYVGAEMTKFIKAHSVGGSYREPWPLPPA